MTTRSLPRYSPWATRALYLFAVVLITIPLLDFLSSVMPPRPGELSWRYGAFGLMAGYLHTPMLGLALALVLGWALGHRWVLTLGGWIALLGAVALLGVMGIFALDVLQMRGMRAEEVQTAILAGGVLQEVKYFTAALVLGFMGLGAIKTAGRAKRDHAPPREKPPIVTRPKAST